MTPRKNTRAVLNGKSAGQTRKQVAAFIEKHTKLNGEAQIRKGITIEQEHTRNKKTAERIALDHLVEYPDYYVRLEEMEAAARKFWAHRLG